MDDLTNTKENFNISEVLSRYLNFWKWFVLCGVISLVAAFFYLRYTSKVYQTSVKIKILDNSKGGSPLPELSMMFLNNRVNLDNEMEILKSHRLIERVVADLDLNTSYYSVGNVINKELWEDVPFEVEWLGNADSSTENSIRFYLKLQEDGYFFGDKVNPSTSLCKYGQNYSIKGNKFVIKLNMDFEEIDENISYHVVRSISLDVVSRLSNAINVKVSGGSEVLILTLAGTNTSKSKDILNAIIEKFNEDGVEDRQLVSQRTIDFVNERFVYLSYELDSIENKKETFKKTNDLSYLEADANYIASKKEFVETEYYAIQTQISLTTLIENTLKEDKDFSLLPSFGVDNEKINALISDYNNAALERAKLKASAGSENPLVKELTKRLSGIKKNILNSINVLQDQLTLKLNSTEKLKLKSTSVFRKIPEKEKILRAIERQQSIKESLYLFLLQKREEASVSKAITSPSIKVVDYAITNRSPISPKRNVIYTIALIIGLIIPFTVLYILFLLDTKIHGKQDFEKLSSKIPVVGEIPFIEEDNRIIKENDRSILAEAFRILRTNVNYLMPITEDSVCKVIYTSSSIKGEGKTFVSLNLALTYASLGKKTLILGADLRNPQIHKYFNMDKSGKGLSNFLYDTNTDWKSLINYSLLDNKYFDVLFAGSVPPNPAELLSNGRFEILLNLLRPEYDYIIVDTAPTILVTDTLLISKFADATVYITRANHTDKKLLTYSKDLDEKGKLKNMAYVINNVGGSNAYGYSYGYGYGYSYGYGYGYNYGYGYGYGEDKEKGKTSKFKKVLRKLKK
jgi:tyrosine-protein kinase Etk/Wzc